MKLRKVKKENGGPARTCFKGGFALLFSVLVSSLLLTIGLSILNISIKELAISTASKQSIYAFYAADSGREYALYNDLKVGSDFALNKTPEPETTNIPLNGTLPVDPSDSSGPNFSVIVVKTWEDPYPGGYSIVKTTINSTGHNSDGGDRVERAIQQTY
jgi:hypothetical protein